MTTKRLSLKDPYLWWALLLASTSLIALTTVWDYGVSWDEVYRYQSGERKLEYYRALLSGDFKAAETLRSATDKYPGLYDMTAGVLRRISPFDPIATGHLLIAIFGIFGIAGTMMLGREVGGPWTGLVAGCLLATCSRYWGHMFINPKDLPFAATFVWGVWAMMRSIYAEQMFDLKWALGFGFLAGLAMSVRIGGLLLFCYTGLFFMLGAFLQFTAQPASISHVIQNIRKLTAWIAVAAVPAFSLLLLFLPTAHVSPFKTTASVVDYVSAFGWQGKVLFEGQEYTASTLPWYYLLRWLSISLPDLWLLALGGLLFGGLRLCFRRERVLFYSRTTAQLGMLSFAVIFPLAYIIFKDSNVYDGLRHILFILPLIASLVAFALTQIPKLKPYPLSVVLVLGASLMFIDGTVQQVVLHPYQYSYFNRLSGGLKANSIGFDTEYWGTSYKEATEGLVDFVVTNQGAPNPENPIRVSMHPPHDRIFAKYDRILIPPTTLVAPYLPKGFLLVEPVDSPEFYVAISRNGFADMIPGETIYVVEREGVEFARVTWIRD